MAVNDKNATSGSNFSSTFGDTTAAAAQPQVEQAKPGLFGFDGWTVSDPAETGPVSANMGSEDLVDLKEKLAKKFGDKSTGFQAFVMLADKETTNYFASIVVALVHQSRPDTAAYHTYVLEASNSEIQDITEQYAGDTYKIKITPDVVFNDDFVTNIENFLGDALPQYKLVDAGATMVPRTFNKEIDSNVHKLAHIASFAATTALRTSSPDFRDLSMAATKGDNNLSVTVKFDNTTRENAVGLPVRTDVTVDFSTEAVRSTDRKDNWNTGKRNSQSFGTTGAFIDAVWAPVAPQSQSVWGVQQQATSTQSFAARVVITDINPVKAGTMGAVLTLLNATLALSVGDMWVNAFRRDPAKLAKGGKGVDWKDVGALNIDANVLRQGEYGQHVVTDPDVMTDNDFRAYMQSVMHQMAFYSIDIPVLGPQSWALDMLRAAANGSRASMDDIVASANDLTDGHFGQLYQGKDPMFVDTNNMVHLGYYEDVDGKRRDIRDIDHLAVLNHLGSRDGGVGRRWSETYFDTSTSLNKRLANRLDLIEAVAPSAHVTSFAWRVTPSTEFLAALSQGCFNAGLRTRLNAPTNNMSLQTNRSSAGFLSQAAFGGSSGVFSQPGMSGAGSSFNNFGNTHNRYR